MATRIVSAACTPVKLNPRSRHLPGKLDRWDRWTDHDGCKSGKCQCRCHPTPGQIVDAMEEVPR